VYCNTLLVLLLDRPPALQECKKVDDDSALPGALNNMNTASSSLSTANQPITVPDDEARSEASTHTFTTYVNAHV
jgi:hypothetical protein